MTNDSSMISYDYDTCMMMSFMPRPALNVEEGSGQVHMYVCTGNYVVMNDAQHRKSKLTTIYRSGGSN